MRDIGPIWRAIMRNKAGYVLIALQIAVTMALMVNAIAIVQERTRLMERDTGVDEAGIFTLVSAGFDPDLEIQPLVAEDLDIIRNYPGVIAATTSNSLPIRMGGWGQDFQVEPGQDKDSQGNGIYFVDEMGIDAFGLEVIAGRNFTPTEVNWFDPESDDQWPAVSIVSASLATALFPDTPLDEIIGNTVYVNVDEPITIIGIVEKLQAAHPGRE